MIKKSTLSLFLLALCLSFTVSAQNNIAGNGDTTSKPIILGGLGLGLDYGGIGFRAEYQPFKHLGIQAGLGYNMNGLGYNFGTSYYPFPDWKVQPYLIGLYGYNGVIVVRNLPEYTHTYFGFSAGLGFSLKTSEKGNKLVFELFKPFRHQAFTDLYHDLRDNKNFNMSEVYIFTFSVGFNWML